MSRKRSQQHLDLQLRDGDETEEDLLLNDEKKIKAKKAQNNDNTNASPVGNNPDCNNIVVCENQNIKSNGNTHNVTKNRKPKKNGKQNKFSNSRGDDVISKKETSLSICHNHNKEDDEVLQNKFNGGGNVCHKQLSENPCKEQETIVVMDLNKILEKENELHENKELNKITSAHRPTNQVSENGENEMKPNKEECNNNPIATTSCNIQQPDIVSWFPLLSKTSAMKCRKDDNELKAFRSNVEFPFTSSSSVRNDIKRNTFNCDDIASPKLAARHVQLLEQAAAKQALISQRKRTPSLCFNASVSEDSDNECQNEIPLL